MRNQSKFKSFKAIVLLWFVARIIPGFLNADEPAAMHKISVIDGVVMPKRPVTEAITEAIQFLKKADNDYVPGTQRDWAKASSEQLAGYFTTAWVLEDGSRAEKQVAFPGRQHAYFIFTFLNYHKHTGEWEWLLRARDLADWNLARSTPSDAAYPNVPYSVYSNGKPGGSAGKDSTEIDKAAFLGSAYIAVYEATRDKKYLAGAKAIAETFVRRQNKDGSWPFRVVPGNGEVREEFGGAPVFFVEFFENVLRHDKKDSYRNAHDKALKLMIERNVKENLWGIYHEDIKKKREDKLSAEPMSFTAIYLFRNAKKNPEYIEMGRRILSRLEERLVHTEDHPAAPAPAVSEQEGFEHMMPGHTARYCLGLVELYKATGDEEVKKRAVSGINALTYMQSEAGLFKTHFQLVNETRPEKKRPNWYSQHLYTVCHVLEALPSLPEIRDESSTASKVKVLDGVVMPKRPMTEAISDAMRFLKKADGKYVPGKLDGELAGYFSSAHVNSDGTRSDRKLSFPARQHAYFIFTFLHYQKYSGEKEWLLRARDLADWNLSHSTPSDAVYANLPYSTFYDGKPGGSKDGDSTEPDKAAFFGSAYIDLYEVTKDKKYLEAARAIAETLVRQQNKDGSWPFRVIPEDGKVQQEFGGAPVFFVEFFEDILRHDKKPAYRAAHDRALKLMLERHVEKNLWGTYHEDIVLKPEGYLSAEPMSFTAAYLFRHGKEKPEYIEMGREMLSRMEERLVHTEGHSAAPAPGVSEQVSFDHIMPGHTARYCLALAELYKVTGDDTAMKKALSAVNALTYMQSPAGLFATYFHTVKEEQRGKNRPDWYSQHLYTVCHVLELRSAISEAIQK